MQSDHVPQPQKSVLRHWGAFGFAIMLAALMVFYASSVIDVARRTTDWLLIVPAAGIGALATLWAGIGDLRQSKRMVQLIETSRSETVRPVILISLTCLYASSVAWIGFDVGTALFILLCLLVQGERSWWKLALASLGGATLMTWTFVDLLLVKLPVLIF